MTKMANTRQTQKRPAPAAAVGRRRGGAALGVLLAAGLLGGCGIGGAGADSSAALLSGMPKCDPSLLHPHIAVGAAAGLPGKSIVFVDGVMACVDDSSHVDQLLTQLEGRGLGAALTLPAAGATPTPAAPPVPR
jgi:hypothetical protein